MAGASLQAALLANFFIGVMKLIFGLLTRSAAMIAEAYHSFADTFNQILLALGIRRSSQAPDLEHPFGYQKRQFFWAFIVAVLIFGISGTLAFTEGLHILNHPDEHARDLEEGRPFFIWNLVVLGAAIFIEGWAWRTAYREANAFKEEYQSETLFQALDDMQDPVLLSLLVEDTLAMFGLFIAFIGTSITFFTESPIVDGITSMLIGIVLMIGGLLLARENKAYLIGKAVSPQLQAKIQAVLDEHEGIEEIVTMKTLLMGPKNMILALDIKFKEEIRVEDGGVARCVDDLESKLVEAIDYLTPDKVFIESQD